MTWIFCLFTAVALAGTPAIPHITTDPLLPQKYRAVPPGEYPCSVNIHVSETGTVTDVTAVECDPEALWPLATAIVQWTFEPATENGLPVASILPYTSVFEVRTLLPRKNVVGFVGVAVSAGGTGFGGAEGRIHLGEQISFSAGADVDRDLLEGSLTRVYTPVVRGDVTISSRRRHFERRGIYGLTIGAFTDAYAAVGAYGGFRGEVMTGIPGLSFGGDAGLATLFTDPDVFNDVGVWSQQGVSPFYPWLRASLIWYAPLPRDHFIVVPREQDPVVFEPVPPPEEEVADVDGAPFPGIRGVHWADIEPSLGEVPPTGPGFALYPPGSYECNVRVEVGIDGLPGRIRVERCPEAGKADAAATLAKWRWAPRPEGAPLQSVFPAPIFVERDDASMVRAQSVSLLVDGKAAPLPRFARNPLVFVANYVAPTWVSTRPTRSCAVDVDVDATGKLLGVDWVSGDIEVKPRVDEALAQWRFYPVPVDGELVPVRVRLILCDE